MGPSDSVSMRTYDLLVLAGLLAFAAASFIFRESLGLIVFLGLAVATVAQLVRMMFFRGRALTLRKLWEAVKDAFWGIG